MPQLVMSRREFAGVSATMTTAPAPHRELDQPRRVVALGWITRNGGHVTISDHLASLSAAPAGR